MTKFEGVVFNREAASGTLISELIPLLVPNNAETGTDGFKLNPQFDQYEAMDQHGYLRIYTARLNGELIGYQIFLINPNMHYGHTTATSDVVYIKPEYRGFGQRFMTENEAELKKDGIKAVFQNITAKKDASKLMARMGYALEDRVYMKVLS